VNDTNIYTYLELLHVIRTGCNKVLARDIVMCFKQDTLNSQWLSLHPDLCINGLLLVNLMLVLIVRLAHIKTNFIHYLVCRSYSWFTMFSFPERGINYKLFLILAFLVQIVTYGTCIKPHFSPAYIWKYGPQTWLTRALLIHDFKDAVLIWSYRYFYTNILTMQISLKTATRKLCSHPVVWKVDNAIHWINHYTADCVVCFVNAFPLDRDLSGPSSSNTG